MSPLHSPVRFFHPMFAVIAIALAALPLVGCKGNSTAKEPEGQTNLVVIARLMDGFMIPSRGQGPKDEAEFKAHVDANGKTILDAYKISDASSIYTSPRDGKPYVIVVGKEFGQYQTDNGFVIAYEQTGVDGVRLVVFRGGYSEEVPEALFKTMVPGAK